MARMTLVDDSIKLTVDVVLRVDRDYVVLIRRAKEPFMDKLALPGGHVDMTDESLPAAAQREIQEELNLSISQSKLELLTILDGVNRDPRPGRRISVVYVTDISMEEATKAIAASDAKSFCIKRFDELKEDDIGFDHWLALV